MNPKAWNVPRRPAIQYTTRVNNVGSRINPGNYDIIVISNKKYLNWWGQLKISIAIIYNVNILFIIKCWLLYFKIKIFWYPNKMSQHCCHTYTNTSFFGKKTVKYYYNENDLFDNWIWNSNNYIYSQYNTLMSWMRSICQGRKNVGHYTGENAGCDSFILPPEPAFSSCNTLTLMVPESSLH